MAPSAAEAWLKSMGLRESSPTGNKETGNKETGNKENTSEAMSLGLYHAQCKDLAQAPQRRGCGAF